MTESPSLLLQRAADRGYVSWSGPLLPFLCSCGRHSYEHTIQEIGTGNCQRRTVSAEGKERSDP